MEGESEPAAAAAVFSAVLDDDDLLGEILARVAFPTSLVRAALVCKRWLRLVSAPAFLRRFGDLHPPSLLGFYVVTMSFTSADGQPPRFVAVPDQPPELDAVVRRANFDVGTFGADIYGLDCWNGLLLTRQVGSRSTTVRNPLCPAAQTTILPPTPSTSIHGGGFTYHYREILPNGVGDDGRMSCFCLAIGRKGHLGQHCVLDVYALRLQDDAWAIYASAVTETSVVHLPLPSLIVDEKICNLTLVTDRYKPGSYKLFWLDLASSRFSLVNLPEEVQYYEGTGLSLANDSGGVHFIYAKGSQLRIWLYKADTDSNGLADWLHVHTVCLSDMIPTSMFGDVMVRAVGTNSAFVFLEKNDVIYLLDIKHNAAKKVYQFITQEEDRFMDGVRPFMMVWPPKFPMMKEGYCDPKE